MSFHPPAPALNHTSPSRFARVLPAVRPTGIDAFALATSILDELQRRGILPTPSNYDIWFTFRTGGSPALSARLTSLIERGDTFTSDLLANLHDEFLAGADVESVGGAASDLQETAESIVGQVAAGGVAMRDYGEALAACQAGLDSEGPIGGLVQAVATLTTETAKAAERNRALQQQLAASALRVSKLRQALVTMKQEATTDPLTGISNRKAFEAKLRRGIAGARGDPAPLSVLLLDIDHFKRFNDTHGHKVGDLVLRLVGRVLADNVKGRDTAARYGGEEFAILLAGADLHAAEIVARQISASLSGMQLAVRQGGDTLGRVTVSVGVAQFRSGEGMAALVERADVALYRAKHSGRNRVCTERDLVETTA